MCDIHDYSGTEYKLKTNQIQNIEKTLELQMSQTYFLSPTISKYGEYFNPIPAGGGGQLDPLQFFLHN